MELRRVAARPNHSPQGSTRPAIGRTLPAARARRVPPAPGFLEPASAARSGASTPDPVGSARVSADAEAGIAPLAPSGARWDSPIPEATREGTPCERSRRRASRSPWPPRADQDPPSPSPRPRRPRTRRRTELRTARRPRPRAPPSPPSSACRWAPTSPPPPSPAPGSPPPPTPPPEPPPLPPARRHPRLPSTVPRRRPRRHPVLRPRRRGRQPADLSNARGSRGGRGRPRPLDPLRKRRRGALRRVHGARLGRPQGRMARSTLHLERRHRADQGLRPRRPAHPRLLRRPFPPARRRFRRRRSRRRRLRSPSPRPCPSASLRLCARSSVLSSQFSVLSPDPSSPLRSLRLCASRRSGEAVRRMRRRPLQRDPRHHPRTALRRLGSAGRRDARPAPHARARPRELRPRGGRHDRHDRGSTTAAWRW